jgi:NAD(P)-dependent dehydrogenase (short-subunit alcohol dehydrogenase family)
MSSRTIVITGAGRGIGQVMAQAFGALGDRVVVADISAERAQATAENLRNAGMQAIAVTADVACEADVQALMQQAEKTFGTIDVLVNAAGAYGQAYRATHDTPEDEWDKVLNSNLKGSFLCAKHVLPMMMRVRRGRIINFASNAARTTSPLLGCSYTAAKTGVLGLTRHLAKEYGPHGITVNTVAPGPVDGERVADLVGGDPAHGGLVEQIPLGRLATAKDISDVVVFMASDGARYMNGAIVDVNGGYVFA